MIITLKKWNITGEKKKKVSQEQEEQEELKMIHDRSNPQ
jgi:hypothetical protein